MARRDLLKIIEFIANDNPDAADNLLDEIELKANGLREKPEL
jgi:plasmid stabilization system protein ParE